MPLWMPPPTAVGPFPRRWSPRPPSTCRGACSAMQLRLSCQLKAFPLLWSKPINSMVFWTFRSCRTHVGSLKCTRCRHQQVRALCWLQQQHHHQRRLRRRSSSSPRCPSQTPHASATGAMISDQMTTWPCSCSALERLRTASATSHIVNLLVIFIPKQNHHAAHHSASCR